MLSTRKRQRIIQSSGTQKKWEEEAGEILLSRRKRQRIILTSDTIKQRIRKKSTAEMVPSIN